VTGGLRGTLDDPVGQLVAVGAGFMIYQRLAADLPQVSELENYQPSLVTKVYDRYGELIADFFIEKRILVPLEDIPLHVRQATIAAEDRRFYSHHGVDTWGILRAVRVNFQAGGTREGASTITQQVARTLFLNRDRTLTRKIREALLARRIEQRYSKDQILEMYLNQIFYGHNAYGIEAAAQLYFGKSAKDLTLSEGALIAGLPPSPNSYSPLNNFQRSLQANAARLRELDGKACEVDAVTGRVPFVRLMGSLKEISNVFENLVVCERKIFFKDGLFFFPLRQRRNVCRGWRGRPG